MADDRDVSSGISSLAGQVLRGFVYLFALSASVGAAVVSVLDAATASTVNPSAGAFVSLALAAVLANDSEPPRVGRLVVFGLGSLALWAGLRTLLDGVVPVGDPGVLLALWLVAFGAAAAVAYGGLWRVVRRRVTPPDAPPSR